MGLPHGLPHAQGGARTAWSGRTRGERRDAGRTAGLVDLAEEQNAVHGLRQLGRSRRDDQRVVRVVLHECSAGLALDGDTARETVV